MSYTGKRPTFNTAALVPSSTAPANPVTGDLYVNDGTGSLEAGLYRYNGAEFVRIEAREKNLVINGGFDFWQRGTSFANVTGVFTADRWRIDDSTTNSQQTHSRSTTVPDTGTNYAFLTTCNTGGAMAAADILQLRTFIEGFNIRELANKPMTLSFWVKATVTGTYSVTITNSANDWAYRTTYTVNATNTFERKFITIPADAFTTGTWDFTTGRGLTIHYTLAAGTSQQGAFGSTWSNPSGIFAVTGQANAMATTGNLFALSNVMFCKGANHKQDFERNGKNIEEELIACQRYFCKSYNLDVNPGTITAAGSKEFLIDNGLASVNQTTRYSVEFPVVMRAAPTIVTYDLNAGGSNSWRAITGNVTPSITEISERNFRVSVSATTTSTTMLSQGHFTAESEI